MFADVRTIIELMEQIAPSRLAMGGDEARIGLQLGRMNQPVRKVLVVLDVVESVVDEAVALGADLIIAHHAVIFRPIQSIRTDSPQGRLLRKCLTHEIGVYVSHTNLDIADGGMNDLLAARLGLQEVRLLYPTVSESLFKLVVFVPESHASAVHEAVSRAGAGWLGNYSHCSFQSPGVGTFMPQSGSSPFIGSEGRLERVAEIRLETILTADKLHAALEAMRQAHPYEEVAYDVYPLEQKGKSFGLGRLGLLPQPMALRDFAMRVSELMGVHALRYVGHPDQSIRSVAVIGGNGTSFVPQVAGRADVLLTGDVDHHTALDALALGLALVDPGHHVEEVMKSYLCTELEAGLRGKYDTLVEASRISTDPFHFLTRTD